MIQKKEKGKNIQPCEYAYRIPQHHYPLNTIPRRKNEGKPSYL